MRFDHYILKTIKKLFWVTKDHKQLKSKTMSCEHKKKKKDLIV